MELSSSKKYGFKKQGLAKMELEMDLGFGSLGDVVSIHFFF